MYRKINLSKYGPRFAYETIDIGIEGAESFEECQKEIKDQLTKIDNAFKAATKQDEPFQS